MKRSRKRNITRKKRSYKRISHRKRRSYKRRSHRKRRSYKRRSHRKRRSYKRRSYKRRYLMKGGSAAVKNLKDTSKWENMLSELQHSPDKIGEFMHGIYTKLKVKVGDHHDLESCVEHIRQNERLNTVLCYISLNPVKSLIDKLDLLKEMALVAEKEIREKQLKLGHKGDHETRKAYLVAYVEKVESEGGINEDRKREIKLLKLFSFLPEWGIHLLELFRLDEKMTEIMKEKEHLHAEMEKLQGEATEKAHELGEKAHELGEKAHELGEKGQKLLDEIHAEDYVKQLMGKSRIIKDKLKEKGVSEELVQHLFDKVKRDIAEGVEDKVHARLDEKLHVIATKEKELEKVLRGKLEEAGKSEEEIEREVTLLLKEVKEHVVALHIHERLHMAHQIGIEIFMGLLLISIFVEDFTEETDQDIGFTKLPIKAVALLKALSENTLQSAINFALRGALSHIGVIHLNEPMKQKIARILQKTLDEINILDDADIEKLIKELNDKDKGRIIYAYNHKRFIDGLSSSSKGVIQGVADTVEGFEQIFGENFLKLLSVSDDTPSVKVSQESPLQTKD